MFGWGAAPPGKVAYHRNGDLADSCLHNIAFATPQELGAKTGAQSSRRPVEKIDTSGEVVAVYSSARAAAHFLRDIEISSSRPRSQRRLSKEVS